MTRGHGIVNYGYMSDEVWHHSEYGFIPFGVFYS